jgi:hypothetical protein
MSGMAIEIPEKRLIVGAGRRGAHGGRYAFDRQRCTIRWLRALRTDYVPAAKTSRRPAPEAPPRTDLRLCKPDRAKRLMGFEPTTFCMASGTWDLERPKKALQNTGFRAIGD